MPDSYYKNIKNLIERNLVEEKKADIRVNQHRLLTYHSIGKEIVAAQGGEKRAKYGSSLIKEYGKKLSLKYGTNYKKSPTLRSRVRNLSYRK